MGWYEGERHCLEIGHRMLVVSTPNPSKIAHGRVNPTEDMKGIIRWECNNKKSQQRIAVEICSKEINAHDGIRKYNQKNCPLQMSWCLQANE